MFSIKYINEAVNTFAVHLSNGVSNMQVAGVPRLRGRELNKICSLCRSRPCELSLQMGVYVDLDYVDLVHMDLICIDLDEVFVDLVCLDLVCVEFV